MGSGRIDTKSAKHGVVKTTVMWGSVSSAAGKIQTVDWAMKGTDEKGRGVGESGCGGEGGGGGQCERQRGQPREADRGVEKQQRTGEEMKVGEGGVGGVKVE